MRPQAHGYELPAKDERNIIPRMFYKDISCKKWIRDVRYALDGLTFYLKAIFSLFFRIMRKNNIKLTY